MSRDYLSEPLIKQITALDWSTDHAAEAVRAVQTLVRDTFGDDISETQAHFVLARLCDRGVIRTKVDPASPALRGWRPAKRRARYVRAWPL